MTNRHPYILVADDDPDDLELLAERFRKQNPSAGIHLLANGQQVLEFLASCKDEELPLLIILDYKMPGLTGADVVLSLGRDTRYRHIPKIVWSTSNNQEFIDRSLNNGAYRFITKPSSLPGLNKIVDFLTQLFHDKLVR